MERKNEIVKKVGQVGTALLFSSSWAQNQKVLSQNIKLFRRAILNYFQLETVLYFLVINGF